MLSPLRMRVRSSALSIASSPRPSVSAEPRAAAPRVGNTVIKPMMDHRAGDVPAATMTYPRECLDWLSIFDMAAHNAEVFTQTGGYL